MVSEKMVIDCPQGIHLRPAGSLCENAMKFSSEVTLELPNGRSANAKSVLSILAAGVKCGDEIVLRCNGEDEKAALESVKITLREALSK
ncbi:MAG: HPr family phosphocarrier protein [Lachnospiraceae bacterium]